MYSREVFGLIMRGFFNTGKNTPEIIPQTIAIGEHEWVITDKDSKYPCLVTAKIFSCICVQGFINDGKNTSVLFHFSACRPDGTDFEKYVRDSFDAVLPKIMPSPDVTADFAVFGANKSMGNHAASDILGNAVIASLKKWPNIEVRDHRNIDVFDVLIDARTRQRFVGPYVDLMYNKAKDNSSEEPAYEQYYGSIKAEFERTDSSPIVMHYRDGRAPEHKLSAGKSSPGDGLDFEM